MLSALLSFREFEYSLGWEFELFFQAVNRSLSGEKISTVYNLFIVIIVIIITIIISSSSIGISCVALLNCLYLNP